MKAYKLSEIKNKRILGRNVKNAGQDENPLALFWAASALEINVKAKEVWALFSADYDTAEPWVSVYVNGSPLSRFMIEKGQPTWICLARGLNPQKENLISIYKDTQPMTAEAHHSLFIHQLGLDEDGIFCPVKERKLKLEIIGDSITSGEGLAGGPDEWEWIPQWFVGSKTYEAQLARRLDADFSVISQCGWGLCWAWDGNRKNKIPPYYDQVCGVMWGDYQEKLGAHQPYDFGSGSDFVIINLGTNDNGAFHQPAWKDPESGIEYKLNVDEKGNAGKEESLQIVTAAKDFLRVIRKNNPGAKIIWVWGMIKLDIVPSLIAQAVADYKAESGDNQVYTLELEAMEDLEKSDDDKGSRGHPGPLTHKKAAQKLYDFIKNVTI